MLIHTCSNIFSMFNSYANYISKKGKKFSHLFYIHHSSPEQKSYWRYIIINSDEQKS